MRLAAVQRWPVVPNPPQRQPSTARSRLASSRTMITFLPPISRLQCLKAEAQDSETLRPTAVDPVNETSRTSGSAASGWPTSLPLPVTRLTTPGGAPASWRMWTRFQQLRGVSEAGLITTVSPQTRAGKIFQEGIAIGKFHGVISAHTPTGIRTVMQNLSGSSEGVV